MLLLLRQEFDISISLLLLILQFGLVDLALEDLSLELKVLFACRDSLHLGFDCRDLICLTALILLIKLLS